VVLALLGLCRVARVGWGDAVRLASVAAAVQVRRFGAAPVSRAELATELRRSAGAAGKVVALAEMAQLAEEHRRQGRSVVLTNGCFDLLHAGHAAYLEEAARLGDVLVVAINDDESVRRLKGEGRPIIGQGDRAALVAALGWGAFTSCRSN
jgi:D-beta-D-heptose 7-phosphate kinase/D-beta-D-heptose 1-phosphate adenosyltransferase